MNFHKNLKFASMLLILLQNVTEGALIDNISWIVTHDVGNVPFSQLTPFLW